MTTQQTLAAYERIVAAPPQEGFELFALALRAATDQERARCVAVIEQVPAFAGMPLPAVLNKRIADYLKEAK